MKVVDTFDFVGITKRFRESCLLFDSAFGTMLGAAVRRENVMRPNGMEWHELLPRIHPLVDLDRVLYVHATQRFEVDIRRSQPVAPPRAPSRVKTGEPGEVRCPCDLRRLCGFSRICCRPVDEPLER